SSGLSVGSWAYGFMAFWWVRIKLGILTCQRLYSQQHLGKMSITRLQARCPRVSSNHLLVLPIAAVTPQRTTPFPLKT
ncbi:hypothetical protein, partial [Methylovulum psychrotolerans]|uniref:hypothetical protein n=1 Tax=Methylovulum psychrotolerans TaxID=1704499 RepID=UPI001B80052E